MRRGLKLLLIVGGAAALTMDSVSMRKIDLGGGRAMSVAEPKENVAAADAAVAEILGIAVDAIKAQRKALASYDNAEGQKLWPASVAFARMLTGSMVPSVKGLRVIELGAGLGVVGVAAALAGAEKVTLTDFQPKSLELAEITAKANGVSSAIFSTRLLDWNHPGDLASLGPYDLVVASDVLYDKALTRVLVSYARKPFDKEPHWGVQTVHKLPKKIPDEAMMAAKAMFFSLDRDNSGSIDAVELGVMLRALGQNPTEEELKALIDSVDGADGDEADGQIQLREFLRLYADAIDATGKKVNKVDKSDVNNVFACFGGDLKLNAPRDGAPVAQDPKSVVETTNVQAKLIEDFGLAVDFNEIFGLSGTMTKIDMAALLEVDMSA
ncbi:calmodulin [Chrysochromulina tobinii]|uniref:Calmodulin n=1 Tax=Chrysochromulina tobinii TaxID=1460289 RepID=A0A0M0JJQ3_9EUKA|nr:calmodulin [Chrysochromulina tobinii]|eukprot:KOO26831.1 calmodulin [Chrysochromulina sp. CCMP291]